MPDEMERYVFNPVYVRAKQYQPGVKVRGLAIYGTDFHMPDGRSIPCCWNPQTGEAMCGYPETGAYHHAEVGDAFLCDYEEKLWIVPPGIWIVEREDGQMFLIGDEAFRKHYSLAPAAAATRTRPVEVH
jgi:hypothetical protein